MQQQKKIELTIPTIDLTLARRLKGGYTLEPSYCIADRDEYGHDDEEDQREHDDWWRYGDDADERDRDDDMRDNDSDHEGDYHGDDGGPDEKIDKNTPLTDELIKQIIGDRNVDYLVNDEWLSSRTGGDGRGAVRYAGQELPDGSIAQQDTIILSENATVGVLLEELFHCWQGENCYDGDGFPSEATSAMELMDTVFDTIYDMIDHGNYAISSDGSYGSLPFELVDALYGCYDFDSGFFDWDRFFDDWKPDYFQDWKDQHDGTPYGRGNDDHWDWNWRDAHDWWEHHRY